MKQITYFPGCTHQTTAKHLEDSARAGLLELGYELEEMPEWTCCGTVYGLASDDVMHQVSPIRNLTRVEATGSNRVVSICAMCYNTLHQANELVRGDPEKLENVNEFMDEEPDYQCTVEVTHLLEFLRDDIGFDQIKEKTNRPLEGLRVAPYYGCLLLRPNGAAIDDPEQPKVMQEFLEALGAEPVDDPRATHCCGSYHTVGREDIVAERAREIISSARGRGADVIALSCPLCEFNLDDRQKLLEDDGEMPILHFTQLLALALGREEDCRFDLHYVDPRPVLREKGLLR